MIEKVDFDLNFIFAKIIKNTENWRLNKVRLSESAVYRRMKKE